MGGFPILKVFKAIVAGQYKRPITPSMKATQADIQYEMESA